MVRHLLPAALAILTACYIEPEVAYPYGYDASLVYVAPGVEVVADYDYPVFFSEGLYWRWYGGYWYRSAYWDRGWAYAPSVPVGIRGVARPWGYSHYRPAVGYRVRTAPRGSGGGHVGGAHPSGGHHR